MTAERGAEIDYSIGFIYLMVLEFYFSGYSVGFPRPNSGWHVFAFPLPLVELDYASAVCFHFFSQKDLYGCVFSKRRNTFTMSTRLRAT